MRRGTKRWLAAVAVALGALGTAGAVLTRKRKPRRPQTKPTAVQNLWARPGMAVIFRAELMPGRDGSERIFRVAEILPSGRVRLEGFAGEHTETEFEPAR